MLTNQNYTEIIMEKNILGAAWKVSKYSAFSGPNTGKYGPKKLRI